MITLSRCCLCVLVGLSVLFLQTEAVAVMSVDLGTESMKVAIVSPGVPMEIALNKESKRKTPVNIALREGDRTFGEDAASIGVRFPKNSYMYLLDLLGKTVDNPIVKLFQKRFPYYDIIPDPERNTVVFQHDSETRYTPEELLGMILHRAKEFAEESAGQAINEAVLTVPGFFNQAERLALLQAADLAGLKVLQLINDYTAVALNYGIFRRKDFNETAQYIIFYDMGASSTTATVVSYQMVKTKERGFVETNPQLSVLGVGYDRVLGGLDMQLRLQHFLAKKFNDMKKTPNDVFKNPRSMAKLFKEAGRVKNVLSANADHYAQVEGLLDDKDFKVQVTREQFEGLCSDLFDRVKAPLEQALKTAGLSIDVVSQVILVGAGTRVPKVQEKLQEVTGSELGKNLNTDEAAVMGAVYKAADLSTGFKVKKFLTKDAVLFPIQVIFERDMETTGMTKQVKRILFGAMNPFPQKKILTFNKHQTDFSFNVNYAELDHLPENEIRALGSTQLSKVKLSGVADAYARHTGKNVDYKGIKAHFAMDESGLLSLSNVELLLEKTLTEEELAAEEESPLSKLGSTISKYFTGSSSTDEKKEEPIEKEKEKAEAEEAQEEEKKKTEEQEEKPEDTGDKKAETEDKSTKEDASKTAPNTTKTTDKKPKVVVIKEPIVAEEEKQGIPLLAGERLASAVKMIESLNEYDRQRTRREGALNGLESFVFDAQTKLDTAEYQEAATDEEIEKIRQACSEVSDWLYEDGSDADAETYEAKLGELKVLTMPLYRRVYEHQERPEALAALMSMINGSSMFLANARNLTASAEPDSSVFTLVELDTLERVINETKEWKKKMQKEQSELSPKDTPKLTIKLLTDKMAILDREVKYLVNKAKIWKPKKKEEPKDKDSVKNATAEESSAEEDKKKKKEEKTEKRPKEKENDKTEAVDEDNNVVPEPEEQDAKPEPTRTEEEGSSPSHTEL